MKTACSVKSIISVACSSAAILVLALGATNACAKPRRLFVQYKCDISNDDLSITTFDINQATGNGRHPDQRNLDFDNNGILFNLPPIPYVEDYSDIKEIRYALDKGNERGYLTVVIMMRDGDLDAKLGYIDEACWNVLSDFLKRKKTGVKLVVVK